MTNPVAPPPVPGGDVPPPPPAGQSAYPPPGTDAPPATEGLGDAPKKSGVGSKLLAIAGVILVGLVILGLKVGVAGLFGEGDRTADATVGTCLNNEADIKKIAIVDCADASAVHKVVGKVPGVSEATFNGDSDFGICKRHLTAQNSLWSGSKGSDGYVLCLEPVRK